MKNNQKQILDHFKQKDEIIYKKLLEYPDLVNFVVEDSDHFKALVRHIIYQQLAGKAADAIFKRFESLFIDSVIAPASVIRLDIDTLRSAGLSNAKANYVKNIAEFFDDNNPSPEIKTKVAAISDLKDQEVLDLLVKIKGVGNWTAEMFLIFTLGRQDVFSYGDYGLKKGFEKLYNIPFDKNSDQIKNIIDRWSPYRTYSSLVLWKVLDNK